MLYAQRFHLRQNHPRFGNSFGAITLLVYCQAFPSPFFSTRTNVLILISIRTSLTFYGVFCLRRAPRRRGFQCRRSDEEWTCRYSDGRGRLWTGAEDTSLAARCRHRCGCSRVLVDVGIRGGNTFEFVEN